MKLKVCGMKYQDNVNAIAALNPDFLGLIFYNKSSRCVNDAVLEIPENIKKIGVFVNATTSEIIKLIKRHNLYAVQLHGNEDLAFCKALKAQITIKIIKVFSVKDHFNFDNLTPFEGVADYFLFDTKGKLPGGNGYTFNWSILEQYNSKTPYFLSGGIGLDEVENIKKFRSSLASKYCYAIDVNSKFETKPGLKNITKLEQFKHELSY